MPLVSPNLDQRTFEQIVTEVRRRIPTFTPEWTDLNESDPGLTLAQLFAFMAEQLLFQVNQVPDKGLITFLKMVGAELHPATPSVADATLTPRSGGSWSVRDIQAGTRLETSAPPPGGKEPITFETIRSFTLLNGTLVELGSVDCNGNYLAHTAVNERASGAFRPLGFARSTDDTLYLAFDLASPTASWPSDIAIRLRFNLAESTAVGEPYVQEAKVSLPCCGQSTDTPPPRLEWGYLSGTTELPDGASLGMDFTTFEPLRDSTEELTRSGYVEVKLSGEQVAGFIKAPVPEGDEAAIPIEFLRGHFVLRVRLLRADAYDSPPLLRSVRLNTVDARAVVTVEGEALGASTGRAFQRFRLANAPVFPGSTSIEVDESTETPGNTETWTEVLDLFAHGPNKRVYQLIPATGDILFGDGTFGKIPPPDDGGDPAGNIRVVRYQFGGGLAGNVGAGTITRIPSESDVTVTNVLPARGGDDEEPITQGVARAPAVVRSRYRAVTSADFEALAKETPDTRVARSCALADTRPDRTPGTSAGCVTVVLVPNALFEESISSPLYVPDHVAAAVLRYLDQRRLITTRVFATSARFRKVNVSATIVADPRADTGAVRSDAVDALNRYFHALVGGDDGLGWPFGGAVFFSSVFDRLLRVDGAMRVEDVVVKLNGVPAAACRNLELCPGELLYSGTHSIRVRASW